MNELGRIRDHIESLLQNAPRTKTIEELRDELYSGCCDKYSDLTAAGRDPDAAFNEVIAGIGDVDELVSVVMKAAEFNPALVENNKRKRSFFIFAGIVIMLVGMVVAISISELFHWENMAGLLILGCSTAGGIVIAYGVMTTGVKYEKQVDTIVEDVKSNMTKGNKQQRLVSAASSSLWTMTAVLYLLISFWTNWWHITWLIFLLSSVLQTLLKAYFSHGVKRRGALSGAFWTSITLLYFVISFASSAWHVTWAIFILAVAAQQIVRLLSIWRE